MGSFRDASHLYRFAALFVIGFLVFWGVRGFVVPRSFGQYGHYRGNAISDVAGRPIHFAGHEACEACHADVVAVKSTGKHAQLHCEACHGPLANHAADPSITPPKLDTALLCVRCHEASAARPKNFPQVVSADHSNGLPCETCHQPHSPALTSGGTK
ncbi:MAG: multiheme c-type cytochrome [Acidobacteriaceae bacterium]|nr:multiheme c-type cytochrome [Acidobacteriaceae bacterium]